MRLKLTSPLQSRDGTLAKGGRMKNCVAEVEGDVIRAVKRPGISTAVQSFASGPGQGMIYLNGVTYTVVNDELNIIAGGGGGGGGGGSNSWVQL